MAGIFQCVDHKTPQEVKVSVMTLPSPPAVTPPQVMPQDENLKERIYELENGLMTIENRIEELQNDRREEILEAIVEISSAFKNLEFNVTCQPNMKLVPIFLPKHFHFYMIIFIALCFAHLFG